MVLTRTRGPQLEGDPEMPGATPRTKTPRQFFCSPRPEADELPMGNPAKRGGLKDTDGELRRAVVLPTKVGSEEPRFNFAREP